MTSVFNAAPRLGYAFRRIGAVLAADIDPALRSNLTDDEVYAVLDEERTIIGRENLGTAIAECDQAGAVQIMAAAMDDLAGNGPEVSYARDSLRRDAAWWADTASPPELETVVAAGLKQIGKTAFGIKARKRLIVMLWQSLGDADRRAFLSSVDPTGKFRGKSA